MQKRKIFNFNIAALILIATYGAYFYIFAPRGRITSPENGSVTSRLFEVEVFTKNLPPSRRYIWVVVDGEALGLCWPKRPIYKANGPFKTMIPEDGPNKSFVVSLYAVDRATHDEILKWFDEVRITGSETGMPILPAGYRLDSVFLKLK